MSYRLSKHSIIAIEWHPSCHISDRVLKVREIITRWHDVDKCGVNTRALDSELKLVFFVIHRSQSVGTVHYVCERDCIFLAGLLL